MKLLLTSNGLSNDSIAQALEDLTGKSPKDTKVAFIPTAANAERGNKDWLINDLHRILQRGYMVDIVELLAFQPEQLKDILQNVDVIFVGGGNTFYLSYWVQRSGLAELLPELLITRVYVGISAGSMVAGTSLVLTSQAMSNPAAFMDEDYDLFGPKGQSSGKTLHLVDFIFRPHLDSRFFPEVCKNVLQTKVGEIKSPVYALDDNSALKIIDDSVEVISEGNWELFNDW